MITGEKQMTVFVSLNFGRIEKTFSDVEGVTFHGDASAQQYEAVTEWEKFQEEGRGSELLVNVDPTRVKVKEVAIIRGDLHVFGGTL
jgi:hypothetical protein